MPPISKIPLSDILPISNLAEYKIHFARWNGTVQPLDAFARDRNEWREWNEYRPQKNDFNRPHIFSLICDYQAVDRWIFGGIWDVLTRHEDRYEIALSDIGAGFIGRLKVSYRYVQRATRVNFENHYADITVQEVLPHVYSGRAFPGFEDIDVSFDELETIIRNNRPDWRSALSSAKGVYLISDRSTGKKYVGAAYGDEGIWQRWCAYVDTGHGGNVKLRALVDDPTLTYCRNNFRFALLEYRSFRTDDATILARESFWKAVLLTRGEAGLN